jgi:hypothetical protein
MPLRYALSAQTNPLRLRHMTGGRLGMVLAPHKVRKSAGTDANTGACVTTGERLASTAPWRQT